MADREECTALLALLAHPGVFVMGPLNLDPFLFAQIVAHVGDRRQAAVPQEVDLDEPDVLDRMHVELGHDDSLGRPLPREISVQRLGPDHDSAWMDSEVAWIHVYL